MAKNIKPININIRPRMEKKLKFPTPKKIIPAKREKTTSEACVESTIANSLEFFAKLLAYKKIVVAITPEKSATNALFKSCELLTISG